MKPSITLLSLVLALPIATSAFAATGTTKEAAAPAPAKVADLNFLGGHWEGHVDNARIEQTCSVSDPSVMVCMFRMMDDKGTQMLEFYSLRDTASGVEERVRFYSPDLKEEPGDGLTLKLASSSANTFIFENPNGTYPKRTTLTRTADDEFHSHIELVDGNGKASTIDAYWKKTK